MCPHLPRSVPGSEKDSSNCLLNEWSSMTQQQQCEIMLSGHKKKTQSLFNFQSKISKEKYWGKGTVYVSANFYSHFFSMTDFANDAPIGTGPRVCFWFTKSNTKQHHPHSRSPQQLEFSLSLTGTCPLEYCLKNETIMAWSYNVLSQQQKTFKLPLTTSTPTQWTQEDDEGEKSYVQKRS